MSANATDSIGTRNPFAYSKVPKEPPDTNLRESSSHVLSSYERAKFYPDEKISPAALNKLTVSGKERYQSGRDGGGIDPHKKSAHRRIHSVSANIRGIAGQKEE